MLSELHISHKNERRWNQRSNEQLQLRDRMQLYWGYLNSKLSPVFNISALKPGDGSSQDHNTPVTVYSIYEKEQGAQNTCLKQEDKNKMSINQLGL
jgi:hypothetical protein